MAHSRAQATDKQREVTHEVRDERPLVPSHNALYIQFSDGRFPVCL